MESLILELFGCAFLISGQLAFLSTASLLLYAHLYQADFAEMNQFINQTKFLKKIYRRDRKGFSLLGYSTKGFIDPYRKMQRVLSAFVGYTFSVILIFAVVAVAIQGIKNHFGTSIVAFYVGIFVLQMVLAVRLSLIGRGLKAFVKHKVKI